MFERFTDRARRVVVLAQEEARLLKHNYIGTEHILLGLLREDQGVGAKALESLGISLEAIRQQVEEIIGRGESVPAGHVPFTPRTKKVLELSLREAVQLGHQYIGTEHLLLGLLREGHGVAAQILEKLGAGLSQARQQVIELLSGHSAEEEAGERETPAGVRRLGRMVEAQRTTRAERVPPPACPQCGAELAKSARHRVLEVSAEGEEGSVRVLFVFCDNCGTALGTFPASD